VHAANAPASSLHCSVAGSLAENENVAVALLLGFAGVAVNVTVGAVVSTVHVNVASGPVLPAVSVACTANVWLPSARPANVFGDVHAANAPASSLHAVVAVS